MVQIIIINLMLYNEKISNKKFLSLFLIIMRKKYNQNLKKIQKQSYKNFEVILVNSSSTDKSFQIVNNYIKK